jgi:alpha-beta hydrolase superfamily lysophospholipase
MPGHGDAPGATRMGVDEHEALRVLVERVAASGSSRVVLMGWSLGAGVSIRAISGWDAQATRCVRGVIAEAPYRLAITPARNMLRQFGMPHGWIAEWAIGFIGADVGAGWTWNKREPFDRAHHAARVGVPVLVLHGDADEISPVEDGEAIAAAAQGTCVRLAGGGHHGLWTTEATAMTAYAAMRDFVLGLRDQTPADHQEAKSRQ